MGPLCSLHCLLHLRNILDNVPKLGNFRLPERAANVVEVVIGLVLCPNKFEEMRQMGRWVSHEILILHLLDLRIATAAGEKTHVALRTGQAGAHDLC